MNPIYFIWIYIKYPIKLTRSHSGLSWDYHASFTDSSTSSLTRAALLLIVVLLIVATALKLWTLMTIFTHRNKGALKFRINLFNLLTDLCHDVSGSCISHTAQSTM